MSDEDLLVPSESSLGDKSSDSTVLSGSSSSESMESESSSEEVEVEETEEMKMERLNTEHANLIQKAHDSLGETSISDAPLDHPYWRLMNEARTFHHNNLKAK